MAKIPSYPPRRYLTADERKAEILSVAIPIFVDRGYAQAEMSEIAKHAGISRALLNRHFGNKDQLHLAALENSISIDTSQILDDQDIDLRERVDHNTDVWLDHFEKNPLAVSLAFPVLAGSRGNPTFVVVRQEIINRILSNYVGTNEVPAAAKVALRASISYCLMVCLEWLEEGSISRSQAKIMISDHIFLAVSRDIPELLTQLAD